MAELNTPVKIGDLELKNRLVLSPLTRSRSNAQGIPNALMVEYYQQRSNAGLLITEATVISPDAIGYKNTPGLWNKTQADAWKLVVDAVHAQGAKIVTQLWHVGRISDPELLGGKTPVAPSAIKPEGHVSLLRPIRDYVVPRALSIEEIKAIVEQYKQSAILAKEAGFDGVELHAANGYLVDQFLQSGTNQRSDEYGGSIENRARFLFEVLDVLIAVWGAERVGIHLSPRGDSHDMHDENPKQTFGYVIDQLNARHLAFVFAREYAAEDSLTPELRQQFKGAWIANENLTATSAKQLLAENKADAVAFGKLFIANPDLLERLEHDLPFNELDVNHIYPVADSPAKGYTDYPSITQH